MVGPEFFQTYMGRAFFESTMPRLVSALERLAGEPVDVIDAKEAERQAEQAFWDQAFIACLHSMSPNAVHPVNDAKLRADKALVMWREHRATVALNKG